MKIEEAVEIVDRRLRAASGTEEDAPAVLRADAQEFTLLFVGMPIDAKDAIRYAGSVTDDTMMLVRAGNSPHELTFGILLRTMLVGMLIGQGGEESES